MSTSNDNISLEEVRGINTANLECVGRKTSMGDSELAGGALLQRKLNLTWKSGMFRPTFLWPLSSSDDYSQITCYGFKTWFKDHLTAAGLPLSFQNFVSQFCPFDPPNPLVTFPVTSHKGVLCIQGHLCIGVEVKSPSLIVCNPLKEKVLKILPNPNYNVGLMHMRVDDSGHYKVLVAGSSFSGNDTEHQSLCTEEYDSRTNTRERVENPELPGTFEEFKNGAYYKDPNEELLFCISNVDTNIGGRGVLKYDFKRKGWGRCQLPKEVTAEGSDVQPAPISIEECGGIIFLFSEQKCGEHVYILIHKLNLDSAGNVTWEVVTRKKRCVMGQGFFVYPSTTCVPSSEDITESGGCVFAFSLQKGGENLCIHEFHLDSSRGDMWGQVIKQFDTPKLVRASNWTDDEKHGCLLLKLEALNAMVKGPPWTYVSEGLWEWGGFDRRPKSCQEQWDTLYKLYTKVNREPKCNDSVNFELGLTQRFYALMEEIMAVKARIKVSLAAKTKVLPGRSRKRIKSATNQPLDDANYQSVLSSSSLRTASEILDSLAQPTSAAGTGPSSSATATAWASTTQPSAADGPSSSTVPPPASTTLQPSDVLDGPTSVDNHFSSMARPAAESTIPSDGRTLGESVQRISNFQRAMNALQGNGQELTDTQKRELFMKTVTLDLLKAKHKNENLNTVEPISKFNEVIDILQSPIGPGFTPCECFNLLMDSLETDNLKHN